MKIEVVIGNIANQPDIDVVVNSANANLRLGSGVAGAIHSAAGKELEDYCQRFAPLAKGKAVMTPGFKLPNKGVIHTCAANYLLDDNAEQVLRQCLESTFQILQEHSIKSVALPAIGTGVFKFPVELVARITVEAIKIHHYDDLELVRICVVDSATQSKFWDALDDAKLSYIL